MSDSPPSQFSRLNADARLGSEEARDELIQLVYQDLRRLAQSYLNRERSDLSLQATALVHETYVRLFGQGQVDWKDRSHFLMIAARQMRRILIDHARAAATAKRDRRDRSVAVEEATMLSAMSNPELVALDDALQSLEKLRPRAGQVVELRFFGGQTEDEIAQVLDISATTVKREWKWARAWLYDQLQNRP